jgi:hypothetical protein
MPAAYSADIRGRVIASVESGSSRREAAEEFDVSASSASTWSRKRRMNSSALSVIPWTCYLRGSLSSDCVANPASFFAGLDLSVGQWRFPLRASNSVIDTHA